MAPVLTGFDPRVHGFHFANRFVNNIVTLPGGDAITTYGRCGGMAYAVLDLYRSDRAVPDFQEADFAGFGGVPPDGHPLAAYIFKRQLDSFAVFSAIKFFEWSLTPDGPTFLRRGVRRWTREDEFAKLARSIDNGLPVPNTTGSGLGQIGIRERAAAMGAAVEIGPRSSRGYRVRVTLPRKALA